MNPEGTHPPITELDADFFSHQRISQEVLAKAQQMANDRRDRRMRKEIKREAKPPVRSFDEAEQRYRERITGAKQRFKGTLFAKMAGLGVLDSHGFVTGWTLGDLWTGYTGFKDLFASFGKNRNTEERLRLAARATAKLGLAAIPGVPAAPLAPIIDQISGVKRDKPKTHNQQSRQD